MASRKFTLQRTWSNQASIGFLGATTPKAWSAFVTAFEDQLRTLNWVNGGNLTVHYRWAEGRADRYTEFTKDFVKDGVDVIVTSGTGSTLAAQKSAPNTPIVFAAAGDPLKNGIIKGFANPGGNSTGTSNGQTELAIRRFDRLRRAVPRMRRLAIIGNRASLNVPSEMDQIVTRAKKLKIQVLPHDIRHAWRIAPTIKALKGHADALYVCTDLMLTSHQMAVHAAALSAGLPTMHAYREFVEAGGLMSYGPDFRDVFRHAANLVDRILRGAHAGSIPVKKHKKCEFVINQSTAEALGVKIPKGARKGAKVVR